MRISAKARYALSAMICISQNYNDGKCITIISLAEKLMISKIYLEQVFSLLKREGLVLSVKGAQGGYLLSRSPREITAFDILSAMEPSFFEKTEQTVWESAQTIETSMQKKVFINLDECVMHALSSVSLEELADEAVRLSQNDGYMYYL